MSLEKTVRPPDPRLDPPPPPPNCPPPPSGRTRVPFAFPQELSIWMCELHNKVNDLLDKPLFDCSLGAIMDRWTPGGRRKPRANRAKLHDNLDCETTFCPEERRSG